MTTTDFQNDAANDTNQDKRGKVSAATDKVRDTASAAKEKASEAYSSARDKTGELYGTARERAGDAYDATREGAARAGRRTAEEIDANPMIALVGGLAVGALAAFLLPKTRREVETFGDLGSRLNETARDAARAAKEAGRDKLDELGYNKDAAKQKLNELASNAGEAVRTSASAAAQTAKGSQ